MELNEYTVLATRTEKVKEVLETNKDFLMAVLKIYISAGQVLDQFKKNIFYNKSVDYSETYKNVDVIFDNLSDINFSEAELEREFDKKVVINNTSNESRMFHALLGSCTEATELAQALEVFLEGKEFDFVNIMEEFGDNFWYSAVASDVSGIPLSSCTTKNIEKLAKRYPDGFSDYLAINRDLESERVILDEMTQ